MDVLELRGYNSIRAFYVFHTLMLGLKMLPSYLSEGYEEFFSRVQSMGDTDKEAMIREAALFVKLDQDEIESLICFVKDENGVAYGKHQLKGLSPDTIYEIIVAVCLQISKIKITLISDAEKKKSKMVPSTFVRHTSSGLIQRFLKWLISHF